MKYMTVLVLLLTACATPPQSADTYSEANVGQPDSENAVIVLYRKTVPPVAFTVKSTLDGVVFASLPNKAFSWAYVPSGVHEIEVSWPILAMTSGETIEIEAEAGKYYFVEFGGSTKIAGFGGIAYNIQDISLLDYEEGLRDVQNCCRHVPSQL